MDPCPGLVVVGHVDPARVSLYTEALEARGREVVTERWSAGLVDVVARTPAAVLVVDGLLGGPDLRALARGARRSPGLDVVMVGPVRPNFEVLVAMASGVSGYVVVGTGAAAVADAVDTVGAGGVVLPRATTLPLVAPAEHGRRSLSVDRVGGGTAELTRREWEVLILVRQGYSTAAMASVLVVSVATVRSHVAAVVRKLGVGDRAALASPPTGIWAPAPGG